MNHVTKASCGFQSRRDQKSTTRCHHHTIVSRDDPKLRKRATVAVCRGSPRRRIAEAPGSPSDLLEWRFGNSAWKPRLVDASISCVLADLLRHFRGRSRTQLSQQLGRIDSAVAGLLKQRKPSINRSSINWAREKVRSLLRRSQLLSEEAADQRGNLRSVFFESEVSGIE